MKADVQCGLWHWMKIHKYIWEIDSCRAQFIQFQKWTNTRKESNSETIYQMKQINKFSSDTTQKPITHTCTRTWTPWYNSLTADENHIWKLQNENITYVGAIELEYTQRNFEFISQRKLRKIPGIFMWLIDLT